MQVAINTAINELLEVHRLSPGSTWRVTAETTKPQVREV
jgi:hypothetical protein